MTAVAARFEARFEIGQKVRIVNRTPSKHHRVPAYAKGKAGVIERVCGQHADPERFAPGDGNPPQRLYRVRILQPELWKDYEGAGSDSLDIEIFENWLEAIDEHA